MNIILSKKDPVGANVSKLLNLRYIEFDDFLEFNGKKGFNLFITRHESLSKLKCVSCHSTGNFSKADFGGKDYTLSYSNALIQSSCLLKLKELLKPLKAEKLAVLEATHHGPSNDSFNLFLEIGSTKNEYDNPELCKVLAQTAEYLSKEHENIMKKDCISAIGIGGGHYAYDFSKIINDKLCIGHICPNYHLNDLSFGMLKQMIEKTIPAPSLVLINKNIVKDNIIKYCQELKIDYRVV